MSGWETRMPCCQWATRCTRRSRVRSSGWMTRRSRVTSATCPRAPSPSSQKPGPSSTATTQPYVSNHGNTATERNVQSNSWIGRVFDANAPKKAHLKTVKKIEVFGRVSHGKGKNIETMFKVRKKIHDQIMTSTNYKPRR